MKGKNLEFEKKNSQKLITQTRYLYQNTLSIKRFHDLSLHVIEIRYEWK